MRDSAKFLTVLAVLVSLPSSSWIAAAEETGVTNSEILIGSCSALKQDLGQSEIAGANAYIDYVNKEQKGVNGRKIHLLAIDDKFTTEGAQECMNQIVKQKVFAISFLAGSATVITEIKIAEVNKIPLIGFASGIRFAYEPLKRQVFNIRATYGDETFQVMQALHENLGISKVAAIYMNDILGFEGLEGIQRYLKTHNIPLVAQVSFLRTASQTDMHKIIETVRPSNPEVVFIPGNYRQAAMVLKEAKAMGWKPIFVLAPGREAVIELAGEASEGLVMANLFPHPSETNLPAVALFRQAMKTYQPKENPDIKAFEGFVHAMLLVEGLKRAGRNLTQKKIVGVYESMRDADLGLGPAFKINFSSKNHQGFSHVNFAVVHNGQSGIINDWKTLKR